MTTAKSLSEQIKKAMEGAYNEEWSIDRFKSEITGDDWGLIVCDGTIIAEIRGALNACGNGENAEYIVATQPKNMLVIISALEDAERERDEARAKLAEAVKVMAALQKSDGGGGRQATDMPLIQPEGSRADP